MERDMRDGQPWLHDLAICVDGNGTALSDPSGTMAGTGAHGFYVDDERVVSLLTVSLLDAASGSEGEGAGESESASPAELMPVSSASIGNRSEFLTSARHLGDTGPDPTVEVHRLRSVHGSRLTEQIRVVSRAADPVSAELRVTVAGDGVDIGVVKAGAATGDLLAAVVDSAGADAGPGTATWSTSRLTVRIGVRVTGVARPHLEPNAAGGVTATLPLLLTPGDSAGLDVTVTAERTGTSEFPAEAGSARVDWDERVIVEAADPRLGRLVNASLADLRSLLLTDPVASTDIFAAAGTPWYLTLFGRDSIWAARMALPLGTDLAGGTLRSLARRQGTRVDRDTAEAPGKIPHELRRAAYVDVAVGFALPPVYYGTVDATALWMILLHDAWRWGLPDSEVRDLLPALRSATHWLTELAAPDDDGLIKYVDESGHGLVNQGWKDSGDSMRFRDGRIADPPIALVEAQAYGVEAATKAAALLDVLGDSGDAETSKTLVAWADSMTSRIRERFWVPGPQGPYLAMAIDGSGAPVDGVGSNMGHVLGTGALTATEARQVADVLTGPTMLGRHGIATLATDNGGFNPIGYHTGSVWVHDTAIAALGLGREGDGALAAQVANRLVDLGETLGYRLPELFADAGPLGRPAPYPASCRPQAWAAASAVAILTVALGLSVDVPRKVVTIRPPSPLPFGPMTVRGLRIAGADVTVSVDAAGAATVSGLPDDFRIET